MKTSTKILVAALLLLVSSLMFYNWQLVAQFRKGEYTDPLYNFEKLNFRNFDRIELRSSSAVNLTVVQGAFKVLANPMAHQFLEVRQEGRTLIVSARFQDHWRTVNNAPVLYVSCPTLSELEADATYFIRNDSVTDKEVSVFNIMPTYIKGFSLDSLTIREDHAASVVLAGNKIGKLTATLGGKKSEGLSQDTRNGPSLVLEDNNQLTLTDLQILHQSHLSINGKNIQHLTYYLADSASLTVNGLAAHQLNLH